MCVLKRQIYIPVFNFIQVNAMELLVFFTFFSLREVFFRLREFFFRCSKNVAVFSPISGVFFGDVY